MGRILTDADINRIYGQHVAVNNNPAYLNRYVPLPLERNTKPWQWEGKAFPRVIAVLEFGRLVEEYAIQPRKLLIYNGGGGDPESQYVQPRSTVEIDYDGTPATDMHTIDLPEKNFDLILAGQTLEHLYHPILALERLYQHLAPGGYLFASAPVMNIPHSTPAHHYTGFTPVGLGCICETAGFDILHIGQWGNLKYIHMMFDMGGWPDYIQMGNEIQNDFGNPADAWILAQRPR